MPAIVRLRIYNLVLGDDHSFKLSITDKSNRPGLGIMRDDAQFNAVNVRGDLRNLKRVNSAVKTDLSMWLCEHSTINIDSWRLKYSSRELISDAFIPRAKYIKHLRIRIRPIPRYHGRCPGKILIQRRNGFPAQAFLYTTRWLKLVRQLSVDGAFRELTLSLTCPCLMPAEARQVVTLISSLKLARCYISFCTPAHYDLETIESFHSAVRQATRDVHTVRQPFRFADLLPELRGIVLSFTDLVSPSREFHWHPETWFTLPSALLPSGRCYKGRLRDYCTVGVDSAWPPCACFLPPTPLFLVRRKMLHDARQVFYNRNRFIIDSHNYRHSERHGRIAPLEIDTFLRRAVPRQYLYCLRDLEIILSCRSDDPYGLPQSGLQLWARTIKPLAPAMRNLSLTLHHSHDSCSVAQSDATQAMASDSSYAAHLEAYAMFVRPLVQLLCIDTFFVFLHSPAEERDDPASLLRSYEDRIEKTVLGPSYDAIARGKRSRPESTWCKDMDNVFY